MADVKINDLALAAVVSTMQLETDIGGTQSNKISIADLTTYLSGVLPITGFTWNVVSTNTNLVKSNAYITTTASPIIFTLPTLSSVGDTFIIVGFGSSNWRINQNSGQTIRLINTTTTTGVSGYIESTTPKDCVEVVCVNADTDFVIRIPNGNINLV